MKITASLLKAVSEEKGRYRLKKKTVKVLDVL
jgi:hypothetical protein